VPALGARAATAVFRVPPRGQAHAKNGGSKLPHSKALRAVRTRG